MSINEIIDFGKRTNEEIINALKEKAVTVPAWADNLDKEYDPKKHPVMDKTAYPDGTDEDGVTVPVTRVTYALQKLSVKRLTELCFGIPVKRVYADVDDRQDLKEIADVMEAIYAKARIDAVNNRRGKSIFASCEAATVWYAENTPVKYATVDSQIKLRCVTYSPMNGDDLYPLFDEYGDLIALSIQYKRKNGTKTISYFETYTAENHYKWSNEGGEYELTDNIDQESGKIEKIPGVYWMRPEPAWEDTSELVYEMEWSMSRNGNYLRENSRPLFVVFADEEIPFGKEPSPNKAGKSVLRYPAGSNAGYVTWQQAVDSQRFHITELRQSFFTQLQLPDWSFDNMKAVPQSGESMKQMFIDAVLKVTDESGMLTEGLDRETNVIKEFMKKMMPDKKELIDELSVTNVITPCMLDTQAAEAAEAGGEIIDGTRVKTDTAGGPQAVIE